MFLGPSHHVRVRWSMLVLTTALASVIVLNAVGVASATSGAQLWAKRYNGPSDLEDYPLSIAASPDGTKVFVTGYSYGATTERDYATVAYDASTGAKIWVRRYNGPADHIDVAGALDVSPDGSTVFVTGGSHGIETNSDVATIAYDASTGSELWVKRFNAPRNRSEGAIDLEVSSDGSTVFLTGSTLTNSNYLTLAYEATTGARLWVNRYDGPGNGIDRATALGVSPDGSTVFVTGSSRGTTTIDYATIAYDASSGAELWVKRHGGSPSGSIPKALEVSPDGSTVFVAGTDAYATVAYDSSSGAELWAKRYDGRVSALGISPDGSEVFVTGTSIGATTYEDYRTASYDASSGAKLWAKRYNGPTSENDDAMALGVSPNGSKVFVTGFSYDGGLPDYATVGYDAVGGTRLWATRRQSDAGGFVQALAVSPNGSAVFVTGESGGDYTTVAYSA